MQISNTLDSLASECRVYLVSFGVLVPENPGELHPDHVAGVCEQIIAFMRSKGFAPSRTDTFHRLTKDRIGASDTTS